jgi:hypothetical protein
VVPSRNTPIRVHPSIILQPNKETLIPNAETSKWISN